MSTVLEALTLLTPFDTNLEKGRIGPSGDGGYVMLDTKTAPDAVLSYGIANQYQFDIEMARKGYRVLMFDHTIDQVAQIEERMEWHKEGVAGRDIEEDNLYTIENHLERFNVAGSNLILKMDVEGAEYDALDALSETSLGRFSQILVEIHALKRLHRADFRDKLVSMLTKINSKFFLYHVHANNYDGSDAFPSVEGLIVSNLLELSFVRKDLGDARPSKTVYPTIHDYPNVRRHNDKLLWFYPFVPSYAEPSDFLSSYNSSRRNGPVRRRLKNPPPGAPSEVRSQPPRRKQHAAAAAPTAETEGMSEKDIRRAKRREARQKNASAQR